MRGSGVGCIAVPLTSSSRISKYWLVPVDISVMYRPVWLLQSATAYLYVVVPSSATVESPECCVSIGRPHVVAFAPICVSQRSLPIRTWICRELVLLNTRTESTATFHPKSTIAIDEAPFRSCDEGW